MQVKQNTCPQLVAAGCVRSFKHNAHRPYADDAGESGMPVLPPPPPPPPRLLAFRLAAAQPARTGVLPMCVITAPAPFPSTS
mmetsp:Transcript_12381/g.32977  ORF Transcript_12381/g.32977 Transcript_12381/m.32977 type:complete len:82 (-) Transcript_12381:932-1177(-)